MYSRKPLARTEKEKRRKKGSFIRTDPSIPILNTMIPLDEVKGSLPVSGINVDIDGET